MLNADYIDTISPLSSKPLPTWRAWAAVGVRKLARDLALAIDAPAVWHDRLRARHALARLDERMLRDIGIARADIWRELDKPFWRP